MRSIRFAAGPTTLALLLGSTALAAAPGVHAAEAAASAGGSTVIGEIIVTSQKREENLQHIAMSVQALDTKKLSQLNIQSFSDYVKFMPSVSFQGSAPNQNTIYMRGVSDGGNGNHSGPQPSVGAYLDEQPITTIAGTLDIHIYDIARVEVLPGPQGTLYGASSEAGTLRIITNKPSTNRFAAAIDVSGNTVAHGSQGYSVDGFVNIPLSSRAAIRLVAFDERDAGFVDNVPGTRPFATSGAVLDNAGQVATNINKIETYGGRAALKIDLNDNWTIMPAVVGEDVRAPGVSFFNPAVGDLQVQRFQPDADHDRWIQASMTITGKIGRFDLTYSGGYFNRALDTLSDYTDYSVAYDQVYGSGAYWVDNAGNPLARPAQEIIGRDRFEKGSNELRIASPSTDRFRFLVGLFQERQTHWIIQDYQIQGFSSDFAVTGWPQTIWLTNQNRIDRDEAVFAEASFDITPKLTVTGGIRGYHYNNTLYGFYGYSANYSSHTGEARCIPGLSFRNAPCVNLDKPASSGSGETYKANLTYKFTSDKLVYFTYSTGYRPGGVNRSGDFAPYQADSLANYELGWKTSWFDHSLNWNGALYDEEFSNFQFAFLGPNSLTIIENAPSARILGMETNIDWRATSALTLSAAAAYNDATLTANFCGTDPVTQTVVPTCTEAYVIANSGPDVPNEAHGALKGQQLPYTPEFKGTLTGRYTFDVKGWNAHAQVSVAYQTRRYPALLLADIGNLGTMPDFATVDFSFGAEKNNNSVELYIKNAFDERGQLNRFTPCTTSICAPAYPGVPPAVYVLPTQPLTVGIRLGHKF
jgi:iron complex outermembrane recepter protein